MIHHFDHQWATYEQDGTVRLVSPEEKADPTFHVMPRYWVADAEVSAQLGDWPHDWLLGWRDIARATDERTLIAAVLPRAAVGNKLPLILGEWHEKVVADLLPVFLSSLACDFAARQKVGGSTLNFFLLRQFPVPSPERVPRDVGREITAAVAQLHADPDRARAAIEARIFDLYGISRDDIEHILDTFPIVRRNDEAAYGEFRTKRLILDAFDRGADEPSGLRLAANRR